MNIQSIINKAEKRLPPNGYISSLITQELFKAGIYGEKEKFSHFAEICPINFSNFEFGEEEKDKFPTFLHAAIQWFKDDYTIELLEKNKIQNLPYKEDYIAICIIYQKLEVLDYFLEHNLVTQDDMWRSILLKDTISIDIIKDIEPEIIIENWLNIYNEINNTSDNYKLYELNTSLEKIIPAWKDLEFYKKQELLPSIFIITTETGKHFTDLVPYVFTQLVMSRFISLDTTYVDKNNSESMRSHIERKKEYLLSEAVSAHKMFEKEQMNYNLNKNLPDKEIFHKIKI